MDEGAADGVVAVAGGRGEVAARLVEGEREEVDLLVGEPLHAAVPARGNHTGAVGERRLDLSPGVAGVHVEWHRSGGVERLRRVGDITPEHGHEIGKFVADLVVGPQLGQRVGLRRWGVLVVQRGEEHAHGPLLAVGERRPWPGGTRCQVGVEADALVVVGVEQPSERPGERLAVRRFAGHREEPCLSAKVRPRARSGVDVGQLETALVEEIRQRHVADRAKLGDSLGEVARDRRLDAVEHDVARHPVELHVAAGREEREVSVDLAFEVDARPSEQGSVAEVESELLAMHADEVEDRAHRLAVGLAEAAAELLEEERGALGGTQHQDGVDRGDVDAFVEEVNGEEDGQAAVPEVAQGSVAFVVGCLAPDGGCCDASLVEFVGHESGVGDADAEAECSHGRWVPDALAKLLDDLANPHVIGRVDVRERSDVVSGASTERHFPQVETVVDSVVGERHQVLLVDRVPHPELGGDTSVEEVLDGEPVGAFRRRRESEQLPRL